MARRASWIEYELGGDTFAIAKADEQWMPSDQGTGVALRSRDLDAAIDKLEDSGVRVRHGAVRSRRSARGVVQDPDGNKIMIHKLKSGLRTMAVLVDKNTRLLRAGHHRATPADSTRSSAWNTARTLSPA